MHLRPKSRPAPALLFMLTAGCLTLAGLSGGTAARQAPSARPPAAPLLTDTPPPACGLGWRRVSSPAVGDEDFLEGVAAVSPRDIWAVGLSQFPGGHTSTLIIHWDGSAWTVVPSPNPGLTNALSSVAAIAADDVWAVGSYLPPNQPPKALFEHWDGTTWTVFPDPPDVGITALSAVSAVSSSDVWAAGPRTMHWDGTVWTIVPDAGLGGLQGIAALTAGDVWAVGSYNDGTSIRTLVEHWDGTAWTQLPSPSPDASNQLSAVVALAPDDAWAAGSYYDVQQQAMRSLTEHWDGQAWRVVPGPGASFLYTKLLAIGGRAAADVWAVGQGELNGDFPPLVQRWDGNAWALSDAGTTPNYNSLNGDPSG